MLKKFSTNENDINLFKQQKQKIIVITQENSEELLIIFVI